MKFRTLQAGEIECRISTIKENGLSLLLYKDARVDQNILDETVGAMNWQRHHSRDNANCIVSIWDEEKKQWIEKEDTGKESNTEKEKGLASDSFKRACVNWGIGRELYSAPFIWIPGDKCQIQKGTPCKCYDKFEVKNIAYDENRNIKELTIYNATTKKVVYRMGENAQEEITEDPKKEEKKESKTAADAKATPRQIELLKRLVPTEEGQKKMLEWCNVTKIEDITAVKASEIITSKSQKKEEEKA